MGGASVVARSAHVLLLRHTALNTNRLPAPAGRSGGKGGGGGEEDEKEERAEFIYHAVGISKSAAVLAVGETVI